MRRLKDKAWVWYQSYVRRVKSLPWINITNIQFKTNRTYWPWRPSFEKGWCSSGWGRSSSGWWGASTGRGGWHCTTRRSKEEYITRKGGQTITGKQVSRLHTAIWWANEACWKSLLVERVEATANEWHDRLWDGFIWTIQPRRVK